MNFRTVLFPLIALLALASRMIAEVRPNPLFSTGAVLQKDAVVPIWGTATDGESVTVEFDGQSVSTTAAKDGKWRVLLKPHPAGGPFTLTIKGENTLVIQDVLVGEVWVCSGQSNMASKLNASATGTKEAAAANYPRLRMFTVEKNSSPVPTAEVGGKWVVCTPETAAYFSAVGYFFGRDVHKTTGSPVGMIHSSWGGTRVESWMSLGCLEENPLFKADAKAARALMDGYPETSAAYSVKKNDYEAKLARWNDDGGKGYEEAVLAWPKLNKQALAQGKPAPAKPVFDQAKPTPPAPPSPSKIPTTLFNGMIAPLIPCAIRGVIWYQGESNTTRPQEYQKLFSTMIADWRSHWGQGDFPFLFVQLPPHKVLRPELREAQLFTWQTTPNTAMAVTMDVGDAEDLHPKKKEPVGARLALAARALAYGEKFEYSGPVYEGLKIDGPRAILGFTHIGGGLVAQGGPLKGFTVAGADNVFMDAQAEIQNDTVVVSSDKVPAPLAVRYGWANVPDVNLFNQAGLPASPFRTDAKAAR